jgi:cysteine-S-conjugate beta-lyase
MSIFDQIIDRNNTHSLKWDKYRGQDILPLWVADMDFKVAPAIQAAIEERSCHPIYGYTRDQMDWNHQVVERMQYKYGWQIKPEWVIWVPGVVPSMHLACRSLTPNHTHVLTPEIIYPHFTSTPCLSGKQATTVAMTYAQGRLRIDLDKLGSSTPTQSRLLLFCNPQNPGGCVYTATELTQLDQFCQQHNLLVCADEIHADLILDRHKRHIPYASVSSYAQQNSIVLHSPSKSFNIAGLACSVAIIPNLELRQTFKRSMEGIISEINLFGYAAALAAYRNGEPWLQELLSYLCGNRDYLIDQFSQIKGIDMLPLEATYLAWLNVAELGLKQPTQFFEQAGVGLSPGTFYGDANFLRLNFACPRSVLEQAIGRIRKALY